jgi:2-dehydropantoate 2-reductase
MRLLVVGAGSVGGYFGGRLAAAGRDVSFLVRPTRAERLRADGLQIISPHGNLKLNAKLLTKDQLTAPFDAVLVAVKAYSLAQVLEDFAPAVGPRTMVLPVLNGMKHVDILRARFGDNSVVGCLARISTVVDGDGRIVHLSGLRDLVYGEMDGTKTARIEQLDIFLQGAGFDAALSQTIERDMWEKWMMLATLGAVNCLMRGSIGEVAAAPGGSRFALQLLEEIVATATALGHTPTPEFVANTKAMGTAKDSKMTASMYRDLQSGRPIEADQIVGDLLARASNAGVDTPLLAAAYTNLCVYQNRRTAQPAENAG